MIIASEQVGKGHPDKIADQISDIVLTLILSKDRNAKVACETIIDSKKIIVAGEISYPITKLLEEEIKEKIIFFLKTLNYRFEKDYFDFEIEIRLSNQSIEIFNAVVSQEEIGAGDQGIIFGFATNETKYYQSIPYVLATEILKRLDNSKFSAPNFDSKSQVAFNYDLNKIEYVLVSIQHLKTTSLTELKQFVIKEIKKMARDYNYDDNFDILVNPSGSFILGGPKSDVGLTGRKIIADTYGGFARHGGGAFSGKDYTKVDRSAAYMLRYIAKSIVGNNIASKIEIQLSYAIGLSKPISINVNTYNTSKYSDQEIINIIKNNFNLTPKGIREELKLDDIKNTHYINASSYGHFLDFDNIYSWEKIKKIDVKQK